MFLCALSFDFSQPFIQLVLILLTNILMFVLIWTLFFFLYLNSSLLKSSFFPFSYYLGNLPNHFSLLQFFFKETTHLFKICLAAVRTLFASTICFFFPGTNYNFRYYTRTYITIILLPNIMSANLDKFIGYKKKITLVKYILLLLCQLPLTSYRLVKYFQVYYLTSFNII